MCPTSAQWIWVAIPHGTDAFLIGFPSLEDLQRVDSFQMSVPSCNAQATVSIWTTQDIPPKRELERVWVHVQGVPYTIRHFLRLWAVGSLIGATMDVDLVTLRSRGIVVILVAMLDSKVLEKRLDDNGPYIGAACVVKLREYDFFFHREPTDFTPDPCFVPFFWRRKGDDSGNDGTGSQSPNMEVDTNNSSIASNIGHAVALAPLSPVLPTVAITPYNPNPRTPRAAEIVARI